jgi:tRNA modification GTPase
MWNIDDLIVAAATPAGGGYRAIVRMAGPNLGTVLPRLIRPQDGGRLPGFGMPPGLILAMLADPLAAAWGRLPLEMVWWPGPSGPLGGPLAEIQLPASGPLVDAFVAEACRQGARLARGGEFSLRSFLAGRLDLIQAEAVLAVVEARTPDQLSAALDRMAGGVGGRLQQARESLLDILADIEAIIDFSDEHGPDAIPIDARVSWQRIGQQLRAVGDELDATSAGLAARDTVVSGRLPRVVLAGRPNIGKSSLFNALVGRSAALIADASGTTRDWIEVRLEQDGVAWMLVDLAGLDEDPAVGGAAAGVARDEILRADLVVACHDPSAPRFEIASAAARIDVVTRCDRADGKMPPQAGLRNVIETSSLTGTGVDVLRTAIGSAVAGLPGQGIAATLRMRVGLDAACVAVSEACRHAETAAGADPDEAVVASLLHRAAASIGEITGREMGNDLLDRIFSRHCIGK